jgi:hypothetical protein
MLKTRTHLLLATVAAYTEVSHNQLVPTLLAKK